MTDSATSSPNSQLATLGGGCFWCLEAVFDQLNGVESVESGYMGGERPHPTYESVCTGTTGHAEVIQIRYNPAVLSYPELLEVFFAIHDPTTLNRQGNDVGTQYRSAIFFHSPEQEKVAHEMIEKTNQLNLYPNPIVTQVVPAMTFYEAEAYHQDYFLRNPSQPYCAYLINPKVAKFRQQFSGKLKS